MMRLRTVLLLLALAAPLRASVPKVGINGNLLLPSGGGPKNCVLTIVASGNFTLDDLGGGGVRDQVIAATERFSIADSTNVTLNIVPNTGKNNSPDLTYYSVTITAPGTPAVHQIWQVPWSTGPLTISQVQVAVPTPTTQGFVADTGGTISGPLIFLRGLRITPGPADSSPPEGYFYYDSTLHQPAYYNGSTIVPVGDNLAVVTHDGTLSGDGTGASPLGVLVSGIAHNSLAGLTSGDPHTQYIAVAGTRAFTGDQSFGQHKATNILLDPRTTAPTGALAGQVYVNTATPTFNVSLSGAWVDMRARGTMTGTQTASTISDFAAAAVSATNAPALNYLPTTGGTVTGNITAQSGAQFKSLRVDNLASDPGSPTEGQVWINATSHIFKWFANSVVVDPLNRANHTGAHDLTVKSNAAVVDASVNVITVNGYQLDAVSSPSGTIKLGLHTDGVTGTSIKDGGVPIAKLEDVPNGTILSRFAAGAGPVQQCVLTGNVTNAGGVLVASITGTGGAIVVQVNDVTLNATTTTLNLGTGLSATSASGTVTITAAGGAGGLAGPGDTRNLRAQVITDDKTWIRADSISLSDGSSWKTYPTVNVTLDVASSAGANGPDGAGTVDANNTWIWFYLIGKSDGTVASLASLTDSPTLPSGYTFVRHIGGARNDGSAHLIRNWQHGNYAETNTPANPSVSSGSGFATLDLSSYVPPWANTCLLRFEYNSGTDIQFLTRPNFTFGSTDEQSRFRGSAKAQTYWQQNLADDQRVDYWLTTGAGTLIVHGWYVTDL